MSSAAAIGVDARDLSRVVRGGGKILSGISLSIAPGELIGVVGGSGAGKSTLLETLAGVAAPDAGRVTFDGVDLHENLEAFRSVMGYVPQEDIIHLELPLIRTLRYAAALRMPTGTTPDQVEGAVRSALKALDLTARADTPVAALSGGQRKRASIAVEMLTDPRIFFLDEPTSGLDPATAASLLRNLRRLAGGGTTVIFTTHAIQDLSGCDRVVFLAPGGHLSFMGSVPAALDHFGVTAVEEIYERLVPPDEAASTGHVLPAPRKHPAGAGELGRAGDKPGMWKQLRILTARTVETLTRNRLTLAILVGSPAMVIALFVILFRPGAFEFSDPQPTAILMIIFWVTFGSFFFGLTYGLLQIVVERPILRREYLAGLKLSSYLLSKVVVMLPFLALVNVAMLLVLRLLDRMPPDDLATYASMAMTLTLTAAAALTLGLAASAGVNDASQATLALPMLCFPAVLFSGAILPVHIMATAGRWIAAAVPSRWGFEAIGHDLGVRELMAEGGSRLGRPLLATYGDAGLRATPTYWAILAAFAVGFFFLTWWMLARKVTRGSR